MISYLWLNLLIYNRNFDYNIREAIARYSNSIQSKDKKYEDYINDNKLKFDKEAPYIIALSGYEQINYGKNFYYPMMALLYGIYYDNINDKYTKRNSIIKPDTEDKDSYWFIFRWFKITYISNYF